MHIIERIKSFTAQALDGASAEAKTLEVAKLQNHKSQAEEMSRNLDSCLQTTRLFRDKAVAVAVPNEASIAKISISRIRENFNQSQSAQSLSKGKEWNQLSASITTISNQVGVNAEEAWCKYADELFTGQTPENIENVIAGTEQNTNNLYNYKKVYEKFLECRDNLPSKRQDFADISKTVQQLEQLNSNFDFNVPEGVKVFLQAIAEGGATLDLLTSEVQDWLNTDDRQQNYKIVSHIDRN